MFRAHRGLHDIFSDARLRDRLDRFMLGDDGVRVVAVALRVMVHQGSFSSTGRDFITKDGCKALRQLFDFLLEGVRTVLLYLAER